jgi:hypothetical protein
MAINIPILSSLDTSGFDKAKREFSQLEGVGAKSSFALQKAALPAAAALGGLAVVLGDATKGAIEDAAAQEKLATQLRNSTGATDKTIAAVEKHIGAMSVQLGIADDELRPAFSNLVRSTKDVTRAQELMAVAADIAAQTGKPLETVTVALAKAEQGQYAALKKLGIPLGDNTRALMDQAQASAKVAKAQAAYDLALQTGTPKDQAKALDKLTEAQERLNAATVPGADYAKDLNAAFGGAASAAAGTAEGQFKRLAITLAETKESIGAALLPAVNAVLPILTKLGTWASEHTGVFLAIAGAIGVLSAAVLAYNAYVKISAAVTGIWTAAQGAFNAVMALNPVTLVVVAIVALVAAVVLAYKKIEGFRNIVNALFDGIKAGVKTGIDFVTNYLETVFSVYKAIFNGIARLWNSTFGKLSFKVPGWVPGLGGKGFDVPDIPELATGGIVTGPTLAMIGEKGPEAVVPLSQGGRYGMGGDIYVTVQGGDPNAVVDALRRYQRQNGAIPIRTAY